MATVTNYHTGSMNEGGNQEMSHSYSYTLYDDPAIINPAELATFPKRQVIPAEEHHYYDHESHLVNRRTPVRSGMNITRTDNQPDRNGFM